MSKWAKFSSQQAEGEPMTPHLTMNLRRVVKNNGDVIIEQMVEHRTEKQMVVTTEWVALPTIYEDLL